MRSAAPSCVPGVVKSFAIPSITTHMKRDCDFSLIFFLLFTDRASLLLDFCVFWLASMSWISAVLYTLWKIVSILKFDSK